MGADVSGAFLRNGSRLQILRDDGSIPAPFRAPEFVTAADLRDAAAPSDVAVWAAACSDDVHRRRLRRRC